MRKVTIVGAGIIGLSIGYELAKKNCSVEIIDQGRPGEGCSWGNAGMVVPSHFVTLPSPGVISRAFRWMASPTGPFSAAFSLDPSYLDFLWKFYRHSRRSHVERHLVLLSNLHLESRRLFLEWQEELPGFRLETNGITMLYRSAEGHRKERKLAEKAKELGIPVEIMSRQDLEEKESGLAFNVPGGIHYPQDASLDPARLMKALREELARRGIPIRYGTRADRILYGRGEVREIQTSRGPLRSESFVIAAGAWSQGLAREVDLYLPVQSGKGYSFLVDNPGHVLRIPKLISEAGIAVTPIGKRVRVAGGMFLGDRSPALRPHRIAGILKTLSGYFPGFPLPDPEDLGYWYGLRPLSPDGLPYLGKLKHCPNLIIATGHSMIGISLSAVTGRIVADMLSGKEPGLPVESLDPGRFTR